MWIDSGSSSPDRHDLSHLGDCHACGRRHQRVEVARRAPVPEVAELVAARRVDERDVGVDRLLEHVWDAVDDVLLLALGEQRSRTDRCEEAGDPGARARIASANVPCGTSVASISPAFTAATASGFDVKYEEIPRLIRPWRRSFPSPRPGSPMLFETIVSSSASELLDESVDEGERRADEPEPPTMTVSPELIADTASAGSIGPLAMAITPSLSSQNTGEPTALVCRTRDACCTNKRMLDAVGPVLYTCADVLATLSPGRWERFPRLVQPPEPVSSEVSTAQVVGSV